MINYMQSWTGPQAPPQGQNGQGYGRLDMLDTADDLDIDIEGGSENASLINKAAADAKNKFTVKFEAMSENVQKKVEEKTGDLTKPNYLWMAIFFAVGCLFLLAAFTSLPFILISPAGFNMYFSLASTCMLVSISFYHGPCNYLKQLFEKKNIMISMLYLCATLSSLASIFTGAGYLWSIGLVILQLVSISFFILQLFTSGDNAQEKLTNLVKQGSQAASASVMQNVMTMAMNNSSNKGII